MKTAFDDLRATLDAVDDWLAIARARPMSTAERALAEALHDYVGRCRRDDRKWRSAAAANRAITKVNRGWAALWARLLARGASRE